MKIYLINHRVDRLKFQEKQFRSLGLKFHRFEVIPFKGDDTSLPFPIKNKLYWEEGNTLFLSSAQLSCFASHVNIWAEIESSQPAIILEDDAIIASCFRQLIKKLSALEDIDYINLETSPDSRALLPESHHQCHSLQKLAINTLCTAGYVLWPSGAKKLLVSAQRRADAVDLLIRENRALRSFQLIPAQIIQRQFLPSKEIHDFRISTIPGAINPPSRTVAMKWRRFKGRIFRCVRRIQVILKGGRIEVVAYWDGTIPEKNVLNSSHG